MGTVSKVRVRNPKPDVRNVRRRFHLNISVLVKDYFVSSVEYPNYMGARLISIMNTRNV